MAARTREPGQPAAHTNTPSENTMTLYSAAPTPPDASAPSSPPTAPGGRPGRLAVPWTTVLTLALLLDLADGFFMTAGRNAVGAIERTQEPFASYWRTGLLLLPTFALGVLTALTLILRRFGPDGRSRKQLLATVALVATAGSLVGVAATTATSAADYRLQSSQLGMMTSMQGSCDVACLAAQQHATAAVHVRAIAIVGALMLLTNLLLVGWLAALRGGRLQVSTVKPLASTHGELSSRARDLRLLLATGLVATAAIHAAVVREHLSEWPAAGLFFLLLTVAEVTTAGLLLARRKGGLVAAALVSVGPLAVWLVSRTAGLPIGPEAGTAEAIGSPDLVACTLEVATLVAALALLSTAGWWRQPGLRAHHPALALVAVVALTTIGLGGTAPGWADGLTASTAIQHSLDHP